MKRHGIAAAAVAALLLGACELGLDPALDDFPRVTHPANVNLDGSVRNVYEESASILALRLLEQSRSPALRSVELPPTLVGSIYNAMLRVHAFDHPVRDSVVDLYRIRAFPRPTVREVGLGVDRTQPWLQRLRNNELPTGNARIDAVVSKYSLVRVSFFDWQSDGIALITLRGPGPLNTIALAKEFEGVAGVRWSEPNGYTGDGDDIRLERRNGGWRLSYSVGYGDCPAGCGGRTSWHFQVDADGTVRYDGRTGGAPPPPRW